MSEDRAGQGDTRTCQNCGATLQEAANFCPNCGASQGAGDTQGVAPVPPEPGRLETPTVVEPPRASQGSWFGRGFGGGFGAAIGWVLGGCLVLAVLSAVLFVGCVALIAAGNDEKRPASSSSGSKEETTTQKAQRSSEKPTAQAQAEPEDSNPRFGDGTHRVGSDIEAGTYRTREGSPGCYYARLSGFSGELGGILANDNTNAPAVVAIAPTDAGFESKRCGTWTQDLSQLTDSATSFEDGTYIVGTDIEPGTYRNSGGNGCYYERMSGFSGELTEIISNENTNAPAVVQIAPTDAGFESKRCGTWERIG